MRLPRSNAKCPPRGYVGHDLNHPLAQQLPQEEESLSRQGTRQGTNLYPQNIVG